ncbi:hypothetical protein BASA50_001098 [Batrachochytrium salamandrivorans]|uniref:Uncharacterized protein n=1 Tax=Batrachochytrium salamandrivorans TaxID=1357716 RepID=A0ABQ8ERM4_9FUNG|nr:hypothetical protein BASA50_001098 [Batrachochytrium salamandrivorans]KAH6591169.1 hypothetical protein BASA61_005069 [Batrachochytrium salamandrivorans]
MKRISFVAIFLLAITVSAYPGLGTPPQSTTTQSAEQHQSTDTSSELQFQSTDTRIPQQPYEDKVLAKLAKLTAAYNKKQATFSQIDTEAKNNKQRAIDAGNEANSFAIKLQEDNLSSEETWELEKKYHDAKWRWSWFFDKYKKQYPCYEKARKRRDDMKAALDLLTENQKLIEKHNDEYDVKTGTSSDSCYNIGLLKNQMDEILNQIEKSIEELERIKANKAPINDGLRAQSDELEYKIRFLQIQHTIAGKILRKYNQRQSIGAQVRGFINSHLPNAQI